MIDYVQMYTDALANYKQQTPRGGLKVPKWSSHGRQEKTSMTQLKAELAGYCSKNSALTTFFNNAHFAADGYSFANYLLDELVTKVKAIQGIEQTHGRSPTWGIDNSDKQFLQYIAYLIRHTTATKVKDALVAALLEKIQSVACPDIVWAHLKDIFNNQTTMANITLTSVLSGVQKDAFINALVEKASLANCPDIIWDTMRDLLIGNLLSGAERYTLNLFLLSQIGKAEFSDTLVDHVYEVMCAQNNLSLSFLLQGLLGAIASKHYSPSLLAIMSDLTGKNSALNATDQMKVYRAALQLVEPATNPAALLMDRLFPMPADAAAGQQPLPSPLLLCGRLPNKSEAALVTRQLCNFMERELKGFDQRVREGEKGRYLQFIDEDNLTKILMALLEKTEVSDMYCQTGGGQTKVIKPNDEQMRSKLPMPWVFLQFLTNISTHEVSTEKAQHLKSLVLGKACDEAINANDVDLWQKLCAAIDTLDTDARNVYFRQAIAPTIMQTLLLSNKLDMLQAFMYVGGGNGPLSSSFSIETAMLDQICQRYPVAGSAFYASLERGNAAQSEQPLQIKTSTFVPAFTRFLQATIAVQQSQGASSSSAAPAEAIEAGYYSVVPGVNLSGAGAGAQPKDLMLIDSHNPANNEL